MAINAQDLVHLEVIQCVSSLVNTLAQGYGADIRTGYAPGGHDLSVLFDQAFELASPVPDFEEAAREAGATRSQHNEGEGGWYHPSWGDKLASGDMSAYPTAQAYCEDHDIEPYEREVFEHWIVSGWLAGKLIEKGEKVDKDFAGMTIWARTTTGQAVYMDGVIEEITAELGKSA